MTRRQVREKECGRDGKKFSVCSFEGIWSEYESIRFFCVVHFLTECYNKKIN